MTYPTPFGSGNAAQPILDTGGDTMEVWIQNVSAINIFVSSKQSVLDGSLTPAGVTTQGFVLAPAGALGFSAMHWYKFKGKLYARANAGGGAVECDSVTVCP